MKKIVLTLLALGGFYLAGAQTPDSVKVMPRSPASYQTDSVKNGNTMYQGGKGSSKSNGDTLSGKHWQKGPGTRGKTQSGTKSKPKSPN